MQNEEFPNQPDGKETSIEEPMPAPTRDEEEKWRVELAEVEAKLADLNERKALLQQVLETMPIIEKLRGNAPLVSEEPTEERRVSSPEYGLKLVNAIPLVLQKYKKPMSPSQIKQHLKDVGFTRKFGQTYFYTAIKRAAEKKAIVRKRDGRYGVPTTAISHVNGVDD
jgi:hypothetical protein